MVKNKFIYTVILLGICTWIIDIAIDSYIFWDLSLVDSLQHYSTYEIFLHTLPIVCFFIIFTVVLYYANRKRLAAQKLKSLENKYEIQFNESLDGIAVANAESGMLVDCNQALLEITGRTREELIGKHQSILHPPDSIEDGHSKSYKKHLSEKNGQTLEERIITKNGEIRDVSIKANIFEYEGTKYIQGIFRDNTEWKVAEGKLQSYNSILHNLIDSTDDATLISDKYALPVLWNKAYTRVMKEALNIDMKKGLQPHKQLKDENAIAFWDNLHKRALSGESFRTEYSHDFGNNDIRHFEISFNPTFKDGEISGFSEFTRDITARKKVDEKLRAAERKLINTFNLSPGLISAVDTNTGYFVYCNPAITSILGFSAEEFMSKPYMEFLHPDDRQRTLAEVSSQLMGNRVANFENRYLCKDGSYKWLAWLATEADKDGLVYGVATDITAQKITEDKLKVSEMKFRGLVETTSDWIWEVDEKAYYTYASSKIIAILGYAPEEIVGKTPFDLMPQNEAKRVKNIFGPIIASQKPFNALENINLHKDGHEVILETSGVPFFNSNGVFCGYRGIDRDITDRKRTEEMLKNSEQKYRNIIDNSTMGISLYEESGQCIVINTALANMIGATDEEASLQNYYHIKSWEESGILDLAKEANESGEIKKKSFIVSTTVGKNIWLGITFIPYYEGEKKFIMLLTENITERKQLDIKLKEERDFINTALNTQPDTFFVFDINTGKAIRWNQAFNRISGYNDHEIANMKAPDSYYSEDDLDKAALAIDTLKNIGVLNLEISLITKDGRSIPTEYTAGLIHDREGNPKYAISIGRDIRARKQAERNLKASEEKFKSITENATDCIFIKDIGKRYTFVNHAMMELLGLSENEILGKTPEEIFGSEQGLIIKEVDDRTFSGENVNETKSLVIGDKEYYFNTLQSPLTMEDGEVTSIMGIVRNITEQKMADKELETAYNELENRIVERTKALNEKNIDLSNEIEMRKQIEKTLLESEERFRAVAYCTADFIWEGNVKNNSLNWIGDIDNCLGYEKGEFPRTISGHMDQIHPEDRDQLLKVVEKSIAIGKDFHASYRIKCKDGSYRHWDERGRAIGFDNGKAVNWVGSVTDFTDKVLLQEKAKSSQARLIHSNKMNSLGTIASGVAHEINNPNSYILSNSQVLYKIWNDAEKIIQDRYDKDSQLEVGGIPFQKLIHITPKLILGISEGSTRIKQIVDNLKDFSRPVNVQLNERININTAIMTSTSMIGSHIQKYTDNFHINCDNGIPDVKGNSQQIEQVIINLVINSLQSLTDKSGKVLISTSHDFKKDSILLSVTDDGSGIPAELLSKIREPYFTTKTDSGGTGLGLAISNTIINDHNGTMDISSEEGKGTTVTVTFPVPK